MARISFRRGTTAQKARSKVAEKLKRRYGQRAFAVATSIVKRAGKTGKKRLARRGLRRRHA